MDTVIEASEIVKHYQMGDQVVQALRGVSLSVSRGEFLVIMGASGSGKSTLMHIMGCLDHPTSGRLVVDGVDISRVNGNYLAEMRNRKIGFVFQQFNLLARTPAINNVELPLLYSGTGAGERRRRAKEALEMVGLGHRLGHYSSQLSGGEQQRVAIARALINNPQIVMADEPTGNLDTRAGTEILAILQERKSRGITVVMVTHERAVAEHGDRIIHLRDGLITGESVVRKKRLASEALASLNDPSKKRRVTDEAP